ncbi:MAG: CAP domain-containing protein [Deltaproteobacteria bacterium]|nr:CAP domain-containing protein [Deltaproteobacteria bacterium]
MRTPLSLGALLSIACVLHCAAPTETEGLARRAPGATPPSADGDAPAEGPAPGTSSGASPGTTSGTAPGPTPPAPPASPPADPKDRFSALRQTCLQQINAIRTKQGVPALTRAADREACVDGQAEKEAKMGPGGTPHGARGACGEGHAQSHADGDGYLPSEYAELVTDSVNGWFTEGPGTYGHYEMLLNPSFTRAACGFYVLQGGGTFGDVLWMNVNYY